MAVKAWGTIVKIMHANYDQKNHASALQAHKQIMQVLIKKVDKAVRGYEGKQINIDERVQIRIAIKQILNCTKLFPSSLKNIVSSKNLSAGN